MPKLNSRLPKYSKHKASGQAVVTSCGNWHLSRSIRDEDEPAWIRSRRLGGRGLAMPDSLSVAAWTRAAIGVRVVAV